MSSLKDSHQFVVFPSRGAAEPRTYQPKGTGVIPTKVPILISAVVMPQIPVLTATPAAAPRH